MDAHTTPTAPDPEQPHQPAQPAGPQPTTGSKAQPASQTGPEDPWAHLEAWDRQPAEGAVAYSQFLAFRDLGRTRTIAKTAAAVERSPQTLAKTAYRQRWVERAAAWDHEVDREHREALAEQRRLVTVSQLDVADTMLTKAMERIKGVDPRRLSVSQVARLVEVAVRVQRLALGESTENVTHAGSVAVTDFTDLSPEQQDARLTEIRREIERRQAPLHRPTTDSTEQTADNPAASATAVEAAVSDAAPTTPHRGPQPAATPHNPTAASTAPQAPTSTPSVNGARPRR